MNLNEIKEALSKATPGPWADNVFEPYTDVHSYDRLTEEPDGLIAKCTNEADAHLLSNAPEWLASLVSQVEEMQSKVDLLQEEIFYEKRAALENHERYVSEYRKVEEMQKTLTDIQSRCAENSSIWAMAERTLQSLKGTAHE